MKALSQMILIIFCLIASRSVEAETTSMLSDPRIDQFANANSIEALSYRGSHFEAVAIARNQEKSLLSVSEALAAARSAWALGLAEEAREYWLVALADPDLAGPERYRTMLAAAILELQEKNFDKAREIAERATLEMEASEIRSQFWLVIADSLKAQRALGLAEEYYSRAVEEVGSDRKAEARFLLAECQYLLGQTEKARKNFVLIETSSVFSTLALNRLAEIDLRAENYSGVITWIEAGRHRAPTEFRGPWQSYAYIQALLAKDKVEDAKREIAQLKSRIPEDNEWYILANASVEGKLAEERLPVRAMLHRDADSKKGGKSE